MKSDSHEFLIKTNREVDEWMDSFYTDGRKAEFRSHCQWAWQEQERRKEEALALLTDIENWLVCSCIATPEDMAQSFEHYQKQIEALLRPAVQP